MTFDLKVKVKILKICHIWLVTACMFRRWMWFMLEITKFLDFYYDLGDNGQCHQMSYFVVYNVSVHICDPFPYINIPHSWFKMLLCLFILV